MNGQRILTSVLALVLALSLAVGLSQAEGPVSSPYQGESRVGVGLAPLGTSFTYQGQLKLSGSSVNGTCDFRFILYTADVGGSQVGPIITQEAVAVSNGLFTVQLDFGSTAFNGDGRWLEIAVRYPAGSGSYTTLSPRQALTAAPYALFSVSTGALQGRSISTTAPALNQVLKWNGSQWAPATDETVPGGAYWSLTGNAGTAASHFMGTTDNMTLTLAVSNTAALRIVPNATSPNLIGGYSGNSVTAGVVGATIGGGGASGARNRVTDDYGTVGGGYNNQTGDNDATTNNAPQATVGGGQGNTASGQYATVGGGSGNTASGYGPTVGGGLNNLASGIGAVVGGGSSNVASNSRATVPGGTLNVAAGFESFAAGRRAKANSQGCFVWGDSTDADVACNDNNRWVARASGGVYFYTNSSLTSGVYVAAGGNGWNAISDRATKENFSPVDGQAVLEKLAGLQVQEYNLKSQDPAIRHIGPVAQDFNAAFGYGESDRAINMEDADGVALAAIQGLYQNYQDLQADNAALKAENAALHQQVTTLEQRVTAIEGRMSSGSTSSMPMTANPFSVHWGTLGLVLASLAVGLLVTRRGGGR